MCRSETWCILLQYLSPTWGVWLGLGEPQGIKCWVLSDSMVLKLGFTFHSPGIDGSNHGPLAREMARKHVKLGRFDFCKPLGDFFMDGHAQKREGSREKRKGEKRKREEHNHTPQNTAEHDVRPPFGPGMATQQTGFGDAGYFTHLVCKFLPLSLLRTCLH